MKKTGLILLFAFTLVVIQSCCKGGSGGSAELVCTVFHHSKPIPGATVYIKYNAKDFPGADPSAYSTQLKATGNSNTVTFTGLHCGDYYLYGTGFDSALGLPVTGGLHFQIKYSDRKKQESTTVAVTE
ncbi:MAG TPA: hypothetical protein VGO45_07455 [Bacteroidia bacterium]|jgi:hypothetical protein|nr:hypothetical protein [Bacteroidia bacterium]